MSEDFTFGSRNDFTSGSRKSYAVLETPTLGTLDKPKEVSVGVCNKAEVIDEEENTDEQNDEGREDGNGEVWKRQ